MLALFMLAPAALALDLWVPEASEAPAVAEVLAESWPGGEVAVRVGEPPTEGEAAWWRDGALALRAGGNERRGEPSSALAVQVLLLRAWVEAPFDPGPPAAPPAPAGLPRPVHAAHLLPSAGAVEGLEVGVGAAATASFETAWFDGAARGHTPVVDAAAGVWRLRANATAWNLWEPERDYRPMLVGGLGVLAVDRPRWRLLPWAGVAMGWKRTEWTWHHDMAAMPYGDPGAALSSSASVGPNGFLGLGASLEVEAERFTWDLSLPLAGMTFWRAEPDVDLMLDSRYRRFTLLLAYPEAGVSWRATSADTLRFGLLASIPSLSWRHAWGRAFVETAAAASLGIGELYDGDLLLGTALRVRAGVAL